MAEIQDRISADTESTDDSVYSASIESELTSLHSSVLNYHYENGRRYHAYHHGVYWGPNDERAMDNLDLGHHLYSIVLQGELYLAPISKSPQNVLDIGTGTGIWAIDFADLHPSAKVIGTDLSPIQPKLVPPNLQFEIDDCCDEWTYAPKSFDFIHVRGLYGCVADWNEFYKKALRHLKPGGYLEQAEFSVVPKSEDGSTDGTIFEKWGTVSLQAGDAFGKTLRIPEEAKDKMIAAGFVDVVERRFKVPVGPWAKDPHLKELGRYNRLYWEEGIQGWTIMLLTNFLKWTREEVELYLMEVRQALRNPRYHAYHEFVVVYGRRAPETEGESPSD